ncbi:centromere DNA-binding like protein [Nitzschia inconspicua]|uniref:Centromere DNA-binding like protein n=1 Tax=Nitzschia inconspicua TaxID=303405 RepID=A0A9K3LXZ5_9STRA|nr:centromere DNA-binding like protein [Nitzschia inconspicua]
MPPNNSSNNQGIIDPSTLQTFGEVARFRQAEIVNQLYNENMRANTARSYEPRVEEFKAYCDVVFSGLGPERRYTVTHEKIYPFMFYQCFREKKTPASRGAKIPRFNLDDYIAIHSKYSSPTPDQRVDDPKVCLGLESIMSYKAALQKFHADQRDDNINNCSWQDHVWLAKCEKLIKVVKCRKQRVKRANYDEKVDHEMSPYGALDHIDQIENALFQMGRYPTWRIGLHGRTVGLLHATVQRTRDPHPVTVMVLQMATGKTNKDLKLYGRVARHKNVNLCSIGALGFYLMYRFHYTGEWDNPPDFLDNKSWFDTKLLIASDSRRGSPLNHTQRISDKSYAKAIKKVCKSLGYANVRLQQLPVHNGGPAEVHSPSVVTSPDHPQTTQSVLPYPGYNHPLRGEYVSVMEMFDEWNGTGNYYNIPSAGGIAELNRRYKSQWRRRYTGAQKTLFSRVQRICQSILDRIGKGESKDSILQQYNGSYINDAKGTPSLLVLVLQARGILSKQQRNRNPIAVDGGSQEHS